MRFLADENFNNQILRGLLRQRPSLDVLRVQEVGLLGKDDASVLDWVFSEKRLLLTHDIRTIPAIAFSYLSEGKPIPGILLISWSLSASQVISDLLLMIECSEQEEWDGQLNYFPL